MMENIKDQPGSPPFTAPTSYAETDIGTSKSLIFRLQDVVKEYTTGAGDFSALKNINLDIYSGEFIGVIGKSGAGKTTLLNMITGVSEITSGQVNFYDSNPRADGASTLGISVHDMTEDQMALWRGRNLGIVYQSFELMPTLDLIDNIMLPQDFTGSFRTSISQERAFELLEMVELADHAYKLPSAISGGQKQRVAIARVLVNDPPVIVADEPTGSLDSQTAETIFRIFERLIDQGKTIFMVTHDNNLAPRFSRHIQIADGEFIKP